MFSSVLAGIQPRSSSNSSDELSSTSVPSGIDENDNKTLQHKLSADNLIPLTLTEKKPSNFETVDIIESNQLLSFEGEGEQNDDDTQSEDADDYISYSNNSLDNQEDTKRKSMFSVNFNDTPKNENNTPVAGNGDKLDNDIYKKELKQCDFQLTYMKSEYKKEYVRFEILNRLNEIVYGRERAVLSWPNCVAMNSESLLICGGSGNFLVFSKDNWQYEIFQTKGSLKKINCCEISEDGRIVCVGDSAGTLGIYDMKHKKIIKYIEGPSSVNGLLTLRIVHQVKGKVRDMQVLTTDTKGTIFVSYITKQFYKLSAESQILAIGRKNPPTQHIAMLAEDIQQKYQKTKRDSKLIALLSWESVRVFSYSALTISLTLLFEFKNPDYIPQNFSYLDMECLSLCWGEGFVVEVEDYLYNVCTQVISWKNKLYVVKALPSQQTVQQQNSRTSNSSVKQAVSLLSFEQSNSLTFEKTILSVGFLASSVILIMDSEQTVYLVNMSDLKRLFVCPLAISDLCKDCGVFPFPLPAKEKCVAQMHKIGAQSAVLTYNNIFCQSRGENEVLFILDGKMGVTALTKWTAVYSNLIENGEWRQAMHYLISIYYAKDKFVTDLPATQRERKLLLEESVKIVSNKYLQMCLQIFAINKDESTKKNMISLIVEFLILTENFELLFADLRMIVEEHLGSRELFIESLVPFIRKHKVKMIPKEALLQLISYFEEHKQNGLAETMLIQLDPERVDQNELIEVCFKKGLIKALIYTCTRGGDDVYMTPLSKLWSHYLNQKYTPLGTSPAMDTNNQLMKFVQSEASEECKGFGMKSLWYAKLCLKQHTITGEIIPKQKFENLVVHIAEWVFDINNLQEILLLAPHAGFELVFLFFQGAAGIIVNLNQLIVSRRQRSRIQSTSRMSLPGFLTKSNSLISTSSSNNNAFNSPYRNSSILSTQISDIPNGSNLDDILDIINFSFDCLISPDQDFLNNSFLSSLRNSTSNTNTSSLINLSEPAVVKPEHNEAAQHLVTQIQQEYYFFIAKLFLEQTNLVSKKRVSPSFMDLSKTTESLSKSSNEVKSKINFEKPYTLKKPLLFECFVFIISNPNMLASLPVSSDPIKITVDISRINDSDKKEIRQTQVLQKMLTQANFNQDQITTLNRHILQQFGFSAIKAEIYSAEKQYAKSFESLLLSPNPLIQAYFFTWLPNILANLREKSDNSSILSIENLIESKLVTLMRIDAEQSRILIGQHLSHLEAKMVKTMSEYPNSQLEYIKKVLLERDIESIPLDLLTLYVELLCTLEPTSLLAELSKYKYDLDACLVLTQKYNVKDASAFILEENGKIKESFDYHLEFLNDIISSIISYEDSLTSDVLQDTNQPAIDRKNSNLSTKIPSSQKIPARIDRSSSFSDMQEELQVKLNVQFLKMLKLIHKSASLPINEQGDKILYVLFDKLAEFSMMTSQFKAVVYDQIGLLIREAQRDGDYQQLEYNLHNKYNYLQLKRLGSVFASIINDLSYTQQTYSNNQEIIENMLGDSVILAQSQLGQGFSSTKICACCLTASEEYSGNNSQYIIFKCGHFFHGQCYYETRSHLVNRMSDKKSLFFEKQLCLACLNNNSFALDILFATETKNKLIKNNNSNMNSAGNQKEIAACSRILQENIKSRDQMSGIKGIGAQGATRNLQKLKELNSFENDRDSKNKHYQKFYREAVKNSKEK